MMAVVGSRNFDDYELLKKILWGSSPLETIISGGASGADSLAARFANEYNVRLIEILPDYNLYKKAAPIMRNTEIAKRCSSMVAFWYLKSRGTKNVINKALQRGKPVTIIPFRPVPKSKPKPVTGL